MDFSTLQQRAAAGDSAARAALIEAFYPRVQALVHSQLRNDYRRGHEWILPLFSTGDIVQDVFRSVLQSESAFAGLAESADEESFARLCATMVRNRLVDALRHYQAERRDVRREQHASAEDDERVAVPLPAADSTPSTTAALQEQMGIVQSVLDELPERERGLLTLRLVEERPFVECALQLGYPTADAARKAFHKAQARLVVRLRARGLRAPGDASRGSSSGGDL